MDEKSGTLATTMQAQKSTFLELSMYRRIKIDSVKQPPHRIILEIIRVTDIIKRP